MWPEERRQTTLQQVEATGDGWRVAPADPRSWGSLSDALIAWLTPKLTPQSIKSYRDIFPVDLKAAPCPHYYLYSDDRVPQPYAAVIERFSGDPNWQFAVTEGGHELLLTNVPAVLSVIETALERGILPMKL
jgi:hypothetical protein